MRKNALDAASKKLICNKPFLVAVKIAIILIVNFLLYQYIPFNFLRIDNNEYFRKLVNKETLSMTEWFYSFWNTNIRLLSIYLFLFIVIIFIFRFRFKKDENFKLSRHTAIITLLCFLVSVSGFCYWMHYDSLHDGLMWQERILDVLFLVITVSLCEEFLYRGFITNMLFRLKPNGLKTPAAIAISIAIFGFIHIQGTVFSSIFLGIQFPPFTILIIAKEFFTTAFLGLSCTVILYYKKDIVSLMCIHTANNILNSAYVDFDKSVWIGLLYVVFYVSVGICYPAFLIYKARKTKAVHREIEVERNE